MIPVQFPEHNMVLGAEQDQYEPLPVHRTPEGEMIMCFRLSPAELAQITQTRTLWLRQLTFGAPFQPIGLSTQKPFVNEA